MPISEDWTTEVQVPYRAISEPAGVSQPEVDVEADAAGNVLRNIAADPLHVLLYGCMLVGMQACACYHPCDSSVNPSRRLVIVSPGRQDTQPDGQRARRNDGRNRGFPAGE